MSAGADKASRSDQEEVSVSGGVKQYTAAGDQREPSRGQAAVPLRVGVFGCGAFGRQHARVYSRLPDAELVGVFDANPQTASAVAAEFGVRAFPTADKLAAAVQAATVAVPTVAHAAVARALLEAGVDVLIEKPIAPTLREADEIVATGKRLGRIVQVGHLERFNASVRLIRPRVTRPLFFEVHRLSVFTPRSLDVDVVLDLMIHDLDIVLSFVRSQVTEVRAVGLPVLTPRVDIANARLSFANGCVANLTASRVSTEKVRKLRFFQPGEYISLDYTRQDAHVFSLRGEPRQIAHQHLTTASQEPLEAELRAFLETVRERGTPEVGALEARQALDAALQVNKAIEEHSRAIGIRAIEDVETHEAGQPAPSTLP